MNTRAAIYIRVSTEEQGDKNLSIPFQLATCHSYAAHRGWTVAGEYVDVASGKNDRRESFQRLIADARSKLFDTVIVYKYSRFARNDTDSVLYERELNRKGIMLVSATEPIDSTTSSGWLNKRILQTFAEFENKQRSELSKAGMREKMLRGEWPWKAPLGYRNRQEHIDTKHTRKWIEPDSDTAPLVVKIFDEAATGECSLLELCDLAEEMGLCTTRGRAFTPEKVLRLLRNPFYKGLLIGLKFDVEVAGVHEAIIDEELWDRVQVQLTVRGKTPYHTHRHKHTLRGLVKCACGLAMTAEFHNNGRNAYLRCVSSANPRYKGCGRMGPRLDAVIRQIEREILPTISVSDDDVDIIRKELREILRKDYHSIEAEIHILRSQLINVEKRLQILLDIRLDNEITKEEFHEKRAELNLERAKLIQRLEQNTVVVSRGEEELERALSLANNIDKLWAEADEESKREILEMVFVKFVVDDKRIVDIEVRSPYSWLMRWKPERRGTCSALLALESRPDNLSWDK